MGKDRDETVPILVVGAGPVGLALAGDLGWRGMPCLVVEQFDGSIFQPRMDLVGVRTMEFCRRWGIVDDVERSPYPRDYPQDNVYLTSMTGHELGRERFPAMADAVPPPESPQKRERCPQNMFDPILRKFAQKQPSVEIRYRTKVTGISEEDDHVVVELQDLDGDRSYTLKARFVVACDGGNSFVRRSLNIPMHGEPALTYTTNVIFRCPHLNLLHDKPPAYRHIFIGPEGTWATIVAINGSDQWRMSIIGDGSDRTLSEDEIHQAIQRAVGTSFEYEILTVMPWTRRELVAERFCTSRVFVIGDAAHVMSPTGGFGMNTGIADAVDLSWKLAATLQGWGGSGLLQSMEVERRPVAQRNVAEASRNLKRMLSPGSNPTLLDDTPEGERTRREVGKAFSEAMNHEWYTLGMHLGFRYDGSPICWPDNGPTPVDDPRHYVQTALPGGRAPHVWLGDGRSTLDLFGRGFVLLRLGSNPPAADAFTAAANSVGLPLEVIDLDQPDVLHLYEKRLVLVRPDGHVAWRGDELPDDPLLVLDCVRGAKPWAWRQDTADRGSPELAAG